MNLIHPMRPKEFIPARADWIISILFEAASRDHRRAGPGSEARAETSGLKSYQVIFHSAFSNDRRATWVRPIWSKNQGMVCSNAPGRGFGVTSHPPLRFRSV